MIQINATEEKKSDEWLEKTWNSYSLQIYNLCRTKCGNKEDAMDVFQNVALRFCQYAREIKYESSICPWLHQVFRNCFYDYVRNRQRQYPFSRASDVLGDYLAIPADRSVFFKRGNQRNDELDRAIGVLSDSDRKMIDMTFQKGLTAEELSALYGVSTNTIVKRRHSAIKRVRAALLD